MSSERIQRYSRGRTCPVCGGSDNDRRGQGTRCHGFIAGEWAHCSREEHAGKTKFHPESSTWSHRTRGECPCGQVHIQAPIEPPRKRSFQGRVVHIYKYRDLEGRVLFEVVRLRDPKHFVQRRPLGNGRFKWDLQGIDPVLYNLPAIAAAPTDQKVFVVEGEKDVDRLGTLGLLATTNAMGAGKWRKSYASSLEGRHVVVIPDNDPPDLPAYPRGPGRHHADAVAESLQGVAASVRVLDLDGLPAKGDVSDWLDARPKDSTAEACAAELLRLADAAPLWQPAPVANGNGNGQGKSDGHANGNGNGKYNGNGLDYRSLKNEELGLVTAAEVEPEQVEWLWKYILARSEMAILAGEGGLGKSTFLLACASAISRGDFWPGGDEKAPLGHVVIVSAEDSPGTTLRPRLEALGADLSRIVFCKARVIIEHDGEKMIHPVSLQNHGYWKAVFDRFPETVLFIVDPIPSYLGRGVNDRQNNEIREVLEPFIEDVIRPRKICFYCNTHLNKTLDARTPVQRITGSIAYANIPRNVHIIVRDQDIAGRRFFKQCKCNNGPDDLPAVAFTIQKVTLQYKGREIETSTPQFEEGLHKIDLAAMMNGDRSKRGRAPVKSSRFADWIWNKLQDGNPVLVMDLVTYAQEDELIACAQNGEKVSMTPLYNGMRRIPDLHPGWYVEQRVIQAGYGSFKRDRKAWVLIQGEPPGDAEPGEARDDDGPPF